MTVYKNANITLVASCFCGNIITSPRSVAVSLVLQTCMRLWKMLGNYLQEMLVKQRWIVVAVLLTFIQIIMVESQSNPAAPPSEDSNDISHIGDDCQVTPVIHVLQYPGCVPKPIPSFACVGRCASYIQVSGSKIWQMERSCMCCQESGEREAAVSLFCPKAKHGERKFKKVLTKAPLDCMCRPCTSVEEAGIVPQEIAGFSDEGPLNNHFRRIALQ